MYACLETHLEAQYHFSMHFHRKKAEAGKHGFYGNVFFYRTFTCSKAMPNTVVEDITDLM